MNDFIFSERLVLIFALTRLAVDLLHTDNKLLPDYVTAERVQDLLNKLGGNVELNTKRYHEEQKKCKS